MMPPIVGSRDPDEFQSKVPEKITVNNDTMKNKSGPALKHVKRREAEKKAQGKSKVRLFYSDTEKMDVCCKFAVCGNSRIVSDRTGIPEGTIRVWKQTEWWNDIMARIHKEADEELDTKLSKLVHKAVDEMNERLENGDEVYNPRLDSFKRKKVSAKDAAFVMVTGLDKRQLLRGQPTSRSAKVGESDRLNKLAEQFKAFTKAKTIEHEPEVIEEEVEVIEVEPQETINEMFSAG